MKRLMAEKVEEAEETDFPPLLLESFKTKAVLAKVFYKPFCVIHFSSKEKSFYYLVLMRRIQIFLFVD